MPQPFDTLIFYYPSRSNGLSSLISAGDAVVLGAEGNLWTTVVAAAMFVEGLPKSNSA
jgi:hypothetical protein